jgi:hypothetical protein
METIIDHHLETVIDHHIETVIDLEADNHHHLETVINSEHIQVIIMKEIHPDAIIEDNLKHNKLA